MPEKTKQRGRHPRDEESFHPEHWDDLRQAVEDFAWLKSRGYADTSSLKLVGDRYWLNSRQRIAVARCTCSDAERYQRKEKEFPVRDLSGKEIHIDGFNLLTTLEAALGGGVLLVARDGCVRDMSSMHGNYRVLSDTDAAIDMVHEFFAKREVKLIRWLLDKPVSNSGRLKAKILDRVTSFPDFECSVALVPDPDVELREIRGEKAIVVTADSGILNESGPWFNAAREILADFPDPPSIEIDLSGAS